MEEIKKLKILSIGILMLSVIAFAASAQELTKDQIIMKNVEAVGGLEKIKNLGVVSVDLASIYTRQVTQQVFADGDGNMKTTFATPPLVEGVLCYYKDQIKEKHFVPPAQPGDGSNERLICTSRLFAGAFSLYYYKDDLKLEGIKKYGPEKHYIFTFSNDFCDVKFNIGTEDFLLKRMEISNKKEGIEEYKVSYDFSEYKDINGLKIPTRYFRADMGAGASARGVDGLYMNFATKKDIKPDFFTNLELNYGKVEKTDSAIIGSITNNVFVPAGGYNIVATNLSDPDIKDLGLKPNDKVKVALLGDNFDAIYLNSTNDISGQHFIPGNKILAKYGPSPYYILLMIGPDFQDYSKKNKELADFKVIKK